MKTVKSEADLIRLAARSEGTVSLAGRTFNADMRAVPLDPPRPPPAPQAAPPPAPPVINTPPIDMAPVANAQLAIGQMLTDAIRSFPQPQRRVPWVFSVEYDKEGLRIKSIRAVPAEA